MAGEKLFDTNRRSAKAGIEKRASADEKRPALRPAFRFLGDQDSGRTDSGPASDS
jgi:hypothetical protein